jgi:hypothetical protein
VKVAVVVAEDGRAVAEAEDAEVMAAVAAEDDRAVEVVGAAVAAAGTVTAVIAAAVAAAIVAGNSFQSSEVARNPGSPP